MTTNLIFNKNNTFDVQQSLISWFSSFNPQYFISIQFPKHLRNNNLDTTNKKLLKIMRAFEIYLLGRHWNRKHIPFIAIAEQGKSTNWHYHILIYDCPFNFFQIQLTFHNIMDKYNLTKETIDVQPIITSGVNSYTSKEFKADIKNHFDTDRIITSEILFNLSSKQKGHILQS